MVPYSTSEDARQLYSREYCTVHNRLLKETNVSTVNRVWRGLSISSQYTGPLVSKTFHELKLVRDYQADAIVSTRKYGYGGSYCPSCGSSGTARKWESTWRDLCSATPLETISLKQTNVINKLIGKSRSNMPAPLFFAELGKTGKMVADRALRLFSAITQLKKGSLSGAAKALKSGPLSKRAKRRIRKSKDQVAQAWLELKYGWLPCLSDVHDGLQSLNEMLSNDGSACTIFASDTAVTSGPSNWYVGSSREYFDLQIKEKASVTYAIPSGSVYPYFGQDPASFVYELIPYSFVLDWFIPVGDFLKQFGDWIGLTFISGWRSTETTYSGWTVSSPLSDLVSYTPGSCKRVKFSRVALSTFPRRNIEFSNPLSGTRIFSALALLNGAFRR